MAKIIRVTALAITGLVGIGVLAWEIQSRLGPDFFTVTPRGNSSLVEARRFNEFELYSAGTTFRGLALNAVDRTANRVRGVTVELSFLYGTCQIRLWKGKADGGCGLPLSIQNWPACRKRIRGLGYHRDPGESVTIRGVPGALYESQGRLALASGKTTIIIDGQGRRFLLAAARSLQGVNNPVGSSEKLPKPARGALDGTLEC
jgi:hypothetical protein